MLPVGSSKPLSATPHKLHLALSWDSGHHTLIPAPSRALVHPPPPSPRPSKWTAKNWDIGPLQVALAEGHVLHRRQETGMEPGFSGIPQGTVLPGQGPHPLSPCFAGRRVKQPAPLGPGASGHSQQVRCLPPSLPLLGSPARSSGSSNPKCTP